MKSGKVGFYGGKFLPLHMGHVYAIKKAACMVEELYIVLSYSHSRDKRLVEEGNIKPLPYQLRLRWLSQLTKDMKNVHVIAVEDAANNDEEYDWHQGALDIKKFIGKDINVVFGSEESYRDIFAREYPTALYEIIDAERTLYPISATEIRRDGAFKHWAFIPDVAKPYFTRSVAIVGTESCGKSVLTKYLSTLFNTSYVEEYGRTLTDELGRCEDVMLEEDFYHIAYGHKMNEKKAREEANKVYFVDSEAIVTKYYAELYTGKEYPLLDAIIDTQHYDLWLYLEPDVKWVDDGTRTFGEDEVREANNLRLKELMDEKKINYISISGDYQTRLEQSILEVHKMLKDEKSSFFLCREGKRKNTVNCIITVNKLYLELIQKGGITWKV